MLRNARDALYPCDPHARTSFCPLRTLRDKNLKSSIPWSVITIAASRIHTTYTNGYNKNNNNYNYNGIERDDVKKLWAVLGGRYS